MKFEANIARFSENNLLWESYIPIPQNIYSKMLQLAPDKRILCILNEKIHHYCAMLPKNGFHYILLNRTLVKELQKLGNHTVNVELLKQDLPYGIPICEELSAVLKEDVEGSMFFHQLTPGAQRSLIHVINKYKNPTLRIERSILLLHHLVERRGALDFKILSTKFKQGF
jgi:hypothetical protein